VLILGALWSLRGDASSEPETAIEVNPGATTTTTIQPPLQGDLSQGWVAVDLPGRGEIMKIADTRFGLVAVAIENGGTTLWTSSLGTAWDAVATGELFSHARVNDLVETGSGLVAVGSWTDISLDEQDQFGNLQERQRPAVWLTADGEVWERLPDDRIERPAPGASAESRFFGSMNAVVVWDDLLVAAGWVDADHHGAVWMADPDGQVWRLATTGLNGSGSRQTEATGLAVADRHLTAVGSTLYRPSVWLSTDAAYWREVEPDIALGTLLRDRPAEVIAGGTGLVAVGVHHRLTTFQDPPEDAYGVIWLTRDGEEWLRMAPQDLAGAAFEDAIAATPWLIAAGSRTAGFVTSPAVWFSPTGAEWSAVELGPGEFAWSEAKANTIVRHGTGLVVGGSVDGMPEVWLWGPDGAVDGGGAWVRPPSGRWVLKTEFPSGFPVQSMGVVPGGYRAYGGEGAWISGDGIDWESGPLEATGLDPSWGYPVVTTINGTAYLADGSGVWSSPDGRFWEQVGEGFDGWVSEPQPGLEGEVLFVEVDWPGDARVWRLSGGGLWSELSIPALEWVSAISIVQDRYLLLGWSEQGPELWLSTWSGEWVAAPVDQAFDLSGQMASHGGRVMLPVVAGSDAPVARVLSSDDGLTWTLSPTGFDGWPGQIVRAGDGVAMLVEEYRRDGLPVSRAVWTSQDGIDWIDAGRLPGYSDSWARVLPNADPIRVIIQRGELAGLWEWVTPGE
jgi:hypothetical protein